MISRPKFGTDGVRGKFGEELDLEYAYALGKAVATTLGVSNDFLIGRDTRVSGQALLEAVSEGIISVGGKVINLGIIPTPGLATIARRDMKPACMITASHNPASDNGIKVFDVGGVKIGSEIEAKIEEEIEVQFSGNISIEPSDDLPQELDIFLSDYVRYLVDSIGSKSLEGLKVVLDCANGAAFASAPSAFLYCGARVIAINVESDGRNINNECGATSLSGLVKEVIESKSDIGFAFDGDADRVIAVDNKGNIRDGDYILALFALEMKKASILSGNKVVATVMSNGGLKKYLNEHEIDLVETKVGDKYVLEEMIENNYFLGGEQSGHIIRRDFSNWGDGTLNAMLVARTINLAKINGEIKSSFDAFSLFHPLVQTHAKVKANNREAIVSNKEIVDIIEQERSFLGEDSRVIIRPSGTEPVVRITVEGLDKNKVDISIEKLCKLVESICG